MLRVVVVLVVVGLFVYAFVDCLRADARDLRQLPRPIWLLAIFVPVVGPVLYLLLGRPVRMTEEPVARPIAPDDDPEFLRRLDIERRRQRADEERRRRRERQEGNGGPEGEDHTGHPA
ncbi:MAG: PLD nuclease N-terminal domain-containing protein [Kineosporiaceae bacterium]